MKEKEISQEEVWDNIATPWKEFRAKPIPEVQDFLKSKKGKILDLCCGSGRNFTNINGTIYGVDFSEKMLKHAKEFAENEKINVVLKKSGADKLPFEDNFFDSAIYIAALHCIESEIARKNSIKELYRVLKKGAEVLITVWDKNQKKFEDVPKQNFISWTVKGKGEFRRYYYLYEKNEFVDLLKNAGFSIVKIYEKGNENINYSTRKAYSEKNIIAIVKK
ncbi:MAG: class I SAM-dependent methyltransferase [Candidatus Pacearchaeota archaeon]|jgi:ubiquinone/menaquinone biosynthesis C-methylase UbiE